jgi:nicotinate-nucleotide--dimethylbenzimidazole phosphoribosyltransferase
MNANPITLSQAIERIRPADSDAMARAEARQQNLTKPPGSLGRLEEVSIRLAGIYGTERPAIGGKAVIVAAGDHGVVAQGVTGYPQEVTAQMVLNFLAGGAAISVMSRHLGIRQVVVDAGVAAEIPDFTGMAGEAEFRSLKIGPGTADISQGPAMSREQAVRCLEEGVGLAVEVIESGVDLLATGDMGIGNTTASSSITSAVTGHPPEETTGEGTGRTPAEMQHKIGVVRTALEVNAPDPKDGVELLAKVGGFEIGVLAGVILGAAVMRKPVVVDGFISGAAALLANAVCPAASDYMLPSHVSAERGHRAALEGLGLTPLLDLGMRLGEGTGAALAMPIIEAAAATLSEMATFAEAGVSDRDPDHDSPLSSGEG